MSGICGIVQTEPRPAEAALEAMLGELALADELERERLASPSVYFGVSRRWPSQMCGAIPGIQICVDADLLNVGELARAVEAGGVDPAPLSLAQTLAWLYRLQGVAFLEKLNGAFSLALWDERERRLVLAIDRLGIKTMFWRREGGRVLFASRSGSIRAAQDRPAEINSGALYQYLLLSVVPAPLSIYRGIERLEPGELLLFDGANVQTKRYWDVAYDESDDGDVRAWADRVREALRSAVHAHLDGCSPQKTGAYLSGGTDSSSVLAFAAERMSPVHTFSISFAESPYNEISFARTSAEHFRADHHERCVLPADAASAIPKIIDYFDEPFANSSAIGGYFCALLAREKGIETLLAGDGGDELFAGNARYASDKYFQLYHRIPAAIRHTLVEPLASLLPQNDGKFSLPRKYVNRANIPNPRRILSYNLFLSWPPKEIFSDAFLSEAPPESWMQILEGHFRTARAGSELNRLLYMDVKVILADNDLRKVNGTAELAGIRVRYPLLDYRLVEFSGSIPTRLKLKGFEKRYIFKKAMEGILPRRILDKKKHGFGVPLGQWFLADPRLRTFMHDVLNDARTRQRGYFQRGFIEKLLQLHQSGYAAFYGEVVWYLVALELWHRRHFDLPPGGRHAV